MTRFSFALLAAALLGVVSCSSSHNGATSSTTTSSTVGAPNPAIGTVATNQWHRAAQGVLGTKPWNVDYARTTKGWRCYSAQGAATPSAAALAAAQASGATPVHSGQSTQCLPPGTAPKPAFTAFIAGPDKDQWVVVGGVADGVRRVGIVFKNRSTTALNVDPKTRLIEWKGPSSLAPQRLQLDRTSCALVAGAVTASTPACIGASA